jgi:hypothetical protein
MSERINELTPVFCETIPETLEHGKLYISEKFELAIHLCACGCGVKTVTSFWPGNWTITNNNGEVTLNPSIGNFSGETPYHAHYFIRNNKIDWC